MTQTMVEQSQAASGTTVPPPELTTLFCRALYDYRSPDANSLSFRQGEIIEVLTQLGSGWWDGIVRGERGWFPSNFTEPISEHEALDEFNRQAAPDEVNQSPPDSRESFAELANASLAHEDRANDFWMPQVTADGQIYYLNTQTGERSKDLPLEPETDDSSGYYPTDSDRSNNSSREGASSGFGVPGKRMGTPEPWQKRLADDGQNYYYYNKLDGTVSWTRPRPATGASVDTPATSVSDGSGDRDVSRRYSVYSDSSDVYPGLAGDGAPPVPADNIAMHDSKALAALHDAPGPNLTELVQAVRAALLEVARVVDSGEDFGREARLTPADGCVPQTALYTRLLDVVARTRELLHVSGAANAGGALSDVWKRVLAMEPRPGPRHLVLPQELKATQRKVAATLSKLVLSARAAGHHPTLLGDGGEEVRQRLGKDASDLESAIRGFMGEWESACVPPFQSTPVASPADTRRLRASLDHSSGLVAGVGAGSAGGWTGWGYASSRAARRPLSAELVGEVRELVQRIENDAEELRIPQENASARALLASTSELISLTADIDIASHVDVEGVPLPAGTVEPAEWEAYRATVRSANALMVRLECAAQGVFDGGAEVLLRSQTQDGDAAAALIEVDAIVEDARAIHDTLHALVSIKQAQSSSVVAQHRVRDDASTLAGADDASVRTGESATTVVPPPPAKDSLPPSRGPSRMSPAPDGEETDDDLGPLDAAGKRVERRRKGTMSKIGKLLGEVPAGLIGEDQPEYMGPSYKSNEILLLPEGVRAATLPALIERLTLHEHRDAMFIDTFMLTFKSFATPDEVLDLLIQRFFIQPPEGITDAQFNVWAEKKQKVVQLRVINILTIMLKDGVLEKEDMHVLARFKEFSKIAQEEIGAAAQPLLLVVERARSGSDAKTPFVFNAPELPPPPQVPKNLKKFKLLDLDPIELARQLTIIESRLFCKLRLMDCLQRAKEQQSTEGIKAVITTHNAISDWVIETIITSEDPKKRAQILRFFIQVAEQCRNLHNLSSMTAIVAGINSPAIRRLKRTWELVTARFIITFDSMEKNLEAAKNFNSYKVAMSKIQPPAVPFLAHRSGLGVYLTALTFNQDGAKDNIQGHEGGPMLINFQKRHKAAEILREIKRYQATPYNLTPVTQVIDLIEDSLRLSNMDRDKAWETSLEREPREREEEKVQRLLQDSGFV
ncbi:ras GEF [Auricularia subglabra TFB-10046 SS5]|nr:ras GEF [Auricularia subglabra TFB-10046 SS5]